MWRHPSSLTSFRVVVFPRLSASLSTHPEKDELILFGGEFFNGKKVVEDTPECVRSPMAQRYQQL